MQRNVLELILGYQISLKIALVQVNLCQKLLFLYQLTHNMTTDCSLNYKFNTWKFQAQNMLCKQIVFCFCFDIKNNLCAQHVLPMFSPCSELGIFMYWTRKSMNNLLSYFGLVDKRIRASKKDLPVPQMNWGWIVRMEIYKMGMNSMEVIKLGISPLSKPFTYDLWISYNFFLNILNTGCCFKQFRIVLNITLCFPFIA